MLTSVSWPDIRTQQDPRAFLELGLSIDGMAGYNMRVILGGRKTYCTNGFSNIEKRAYRLQQHYNEVGQASGEATC